MLNAHGPMLNLRTPSAAAALLGLGLLFVALRWNSYDLPLVRDEGEYAYAAQLLKHGLLPYENAFLQKPPMAVYTYALSAAIAPKIYWFPRVLAAMFVALATGLLGLIARLEFGPRLAWPTMWLFTAMVVMPGIPQFAANTEVFLLLPLLATFACYAVARHGRGGQSDLASSANVARTALSAGFRSPARLFTRAGLSALFREFAIRDGAAAWFMAGFFAAATLLYKYTALPLAVFLFATWSFQEWRAGAGLRALGRHWCLGLMGGGFAALAALGLFLIHDGGRSLWECTIHFNRFYKNNASFGLAALWFCLKLLWANWWLPFLLPCLLLLRPTPRMRFWLATFLASWLATAASIYGHYYIVVTPFWALLNAVAIDRAASWLAAKLAGPLHLLNRIITAAVVLVICLPHLPWIFCTKDEFGAARRGGTPYLESTDVARRVAELSSPEDYVFVAGSEPQILSYAGRLSPTRFVIVYPLMFPSPLALGYQQEAIRDLEQRPPALIVLSRSNTSWLVQPGSPGDFVSYLETLLAERYERVGGYVSESRGEGWQEPLSDQQFAASSLVLYRRKK